MIQDLASMVAEGIELGLSQEGVLQIYLTIDGGEKAPWFLTIDSEGVSYGQGEHPRPDTAIHLNCLQLAALKSGQLNLRDVALIAALTIKGDLAFLQEIVSACSRPPLTTVKAFAAAETKAYTETLSSVSIAINPTKDEVWAVVRAAAPCVISELLDWGALKWDFEYIRTRFGDEVFRPGPNGGERISVLIDRVLRGDRVYSYGCAVPEAMRAEFSFPYFDESNLSPKQLWIGTCSPLLVTGLHRDARPVLLAQILGRKRVILYSPNQSEFMYARRAYNTYYQQCWVDPDNPDFLRFPKFAQAIPISIDLNPGEILYIPTGWFHCVYALDNVLSVSTIITTDSGWEEPHTLSKSL